MRTVRERKQTNVSVPLPGKETLLFHGIQSFEDVETREYPRIDSLFFFNTKHIYVQAYENFSLPKEHEQSLVATDCF